jgi:hypothetical protein
MDTMSLNHNFLILIHNFYTWSLLHHSLLLLYALHHNNVTIHNEGVYIPFPSCTLKLSNLHIQFYLLALTTINAFYLLRTRADHSRFDYILQGRSFLMTSFNILRYFQNLCWALFQLSVVSALAHLRCSCIILPLLKIFMGSCL